MVKLLKMTTKIYVRIKIIPNQRHTIIENFIKRGNIHEKDISAKQNKEEQKTWIQVQNEQRCGKKSFKKKAK